MQTIIGILLIVGGAILGLYVGIWVCFIGGIIDVIHCVQTEDFVAMTLAIGIAKIVFAGLAGWVSAIIPIFIGHFMLD